MKRLVGILSIIVAVAIVATLSIRHEEPSKKEDVPIPIQVPFIPIDPKKVTDIIIGHGQVRPRWETTLASEIEGHVLSVSNKFLSGSRFKKGDVLATVDTTNYQAALASAKANLTTSLRTLREEEQRYRVAAENWESSGFKEPESDLVLRKPQLQEAQAKVESAQAAIRKAEYDLARTKITAPYDGIVTERTINPGEFIQMGTPIGSIYDSSTYEVVIPLNDPQIHRLPPDNKGASVTLRSLQSDKTWMGTFARVEQAVDPVNRWQNVIIEIIDTNGLLPGYFLTAEIGGKVYNDMVRIPENMLGNDGYIWFIDAKNHLQRFAPETLFRRNGNMFTLSYPDQITDLRVTPGRKVYLPGMKVTPVSEMDQIAKNKKVKTKPHE